MISQVIELHDMGHKDGSISPSEDQSRYDFEQESIQDMDMRDEEEYMLRGKYSPSTFPLH